MGLGFLLAHASQVFLAVQTRGAGCKDPKALRRVALQDACHLQLNTSEHNSESELTVSGVTIVTEPSLLMRASLLWTTASLEHVSQHGIMGRKRTPQTLTSEFGLT